MANFSSSIAPTYEVECECARKHILLHPCPYLGEIENDYETLCNCCDVCEQHCADQI